MKREESQKIKDVSLEKVKAQIYRRAEDRNVCMIFLSAPVLFYVFMAVKHLQRESNKDRSTLDFSAGSTLLQKKNVKKIHFFLLNNCCLELDIASNKKPNSLFIYQISILLSL